MNLSDPTKRLDIVIELKRLKDLCNAYETNITSSNNQSHNTYLDTHLNTLTITPKSDAICPSVSKEIAHFENTTAHLDTLCPSNMQDFCDSTRIVATNEEIWKQIIYSVCYLEYMFC